ncbi:MAG TPA: hypothetical protein ENI34_09575 [candidate division WOR-3 bacterium]|uniref:FlgD Ig-like domain-containing protein n=1 Tax=candidate division WOR-3 bacterium TaxID=2052148 RepID=A0A9C9EP22_UNCW3|nr:hypothetical protein [candidate division WOR-3 bacterium]
MVKHLFFILIFISIPAVLFGSWDVDTIFIWDNDRGESIQTMPAVGIIGGGSNGGFAAWQDSRWGDYDIFRQRYFWNGVLPVPNFMVSQDDFNRFQQVHTDVSSNPQNGCIVVWEDSSYQPQKPAKIYCALYGMEPFLVYEAESSQKFPAVSSRYYGWFAISWTSYTTSQMPAILCKFYDENGVEQRFNTVRQRDSIDFAVPVSRVAYNDSGALIVYEDYSSDGTQCSIYGQYCNRNGAILVPRQKLSHLAGDSRDERSPDVAINENGYMVVVWEDYRSGDADIYAQRFVVLPDTFEFIGSEMVISEISGVDELYPHVALFADGSFVVVWHDKRGSDYDVYYRAWVNGYGLKEPHRVPHNNTADQMYPDVAGRYGENLSIVWASRVYSDYDDVFLRNFTLSSQGATGIDSITGDIPLVPVDPDTNVGGRKCWYFDDENYDDPATPGWNEDPIAEAESVYIDLDSAIIDQLMELNTNGQYFIVSEDTLPYRQGFRALSEYDAIFLDLGYRTGLATAGTISQDDQDALVDYIEPSTPGDTGKPTMVDGNDFGYMYKGTALFSLYHAEYLGDGAPYGSGNVDTLYGVAGQFAENETLKYDYKEPVDNYVDSIAAYNGGRLLLQSSGVTDWMAGRAVCWGNYWKGGMRTPQGNTIYNSFIPTGITSTRHPNTYAEYYRRCLGFLGLNCQPEPITTLHAYIGSSEGRVVIEWQVVSDDSLTESAEGDYKLKFSRQKITSETAFNDSVEEYYQEWNTKDSAVGVWVTQTLYGLPPLDTLIFALKVSDESGLWDALGAEPRAVVAGDSITPHNILIANNYVKDFSIRYEFLDVHISNPEDSLFVTWDDDSFYIGFIGQSFVGSGDLLIYFDITNGVGADSTYPYNGTTTNCAPFNAASGEFRPDYCFILETYNTVYLYQCTGKQRGRDAWTPITFHGAYSEDNVVHNYEYTEISIPFSDLGYNTSNPFKLVVTVQSETDNSRTHIYPIFNPTGIGTITQYYQWSHLGADMVPRYTVSVVGVDESELFTGLSHGEKDLSVVPNPFTRGVDIYFSPGRLKSEEIILKIFDATGRLVKRFELSSSAPDTMMRVTWNGCDEAGHRMSGGVYFCELEAADHSVFEKMIYLR